MNVLDSFNLKGKVALVTGGAGLYGRQIVEALVEAGTSTIMASRNLDKLNKYAMKLKRRQLDVGTLSFDQGNEESINELYREVLNMKGKVDILVNNAVLRPMADWNSPADQFFKSMEVNATGTFLMTRIFGNHMAGKGSGSIINIGSIQGMVGPDLTLYEDSDMTAPAPDYFFHKGGMLQLTRYAASILGPHGVRVNTVSPGGFYNKQPDNFVKRYHDHTFMNKMADEEALKGVIVFLASEASNHITGANIPVDAGYTAK